MSTPVAENRGCRNCLATPQTHGGFTSGEGRNICLLVESRNFHSVVYLIALCNRQRIEARASVLLRCSAFIQIVMASMPLRALFHVEKKSSTSEPAHKHSPGLVRPAFATSKPSAVSQDTVSPTLDHQRAKGPNLPTHTSAGEQRAVVAEESGEDAITRPHPVQTRIINNTQAEEVCGFPCPATQHEPQTPNEIESSRLSSPTTRQGIDVTQSWRAPSINKWRFISVCFVAIGNGMNDSGKA